MEAARDFQIKEKLNVNNRFEMISINRRTLKIREPYPKTMYIALSALIESVTILDSVSMVMVEARPIY